MLKLLNEHSGSQAQICKFQWYPNHGLRPRNWSLWIYIVVAVVTGVALTALRFGPGLAKTGLIAGTLTGPFGKLVDKHVTDPWLRNMIDLECFVLRSPPPVFPI